MPFFDAETLQNAQKANLDLLQQMTAKVFEGTEQLTQLNIKTARAAMDNSFANYRALLEVRDPQGIAGLQSSLGNPSAQLEQVMEYSRQVYDVCSSTQAGVTSLLEEQIATNTQRMQGIVVDMARNVPAGAEPVVAAFKSAVDSANTVYENASKTARKAKEMAEANIANATNMAREATRDVNEKTEEAMSA